MLLLTPAQIPDSTIGRAVDAVFRDPAFNRYSLWQKLVAWVSEMAMRLMAFLDPLLSTLRRSPMLFWTVIVVLAAILVAIVVRAVYLWRLRGHQRADAVRWDRSHPRLLGRDPWEAAEELARRGEFTDAAHALYVALLEAAARQQQLRLHPSKTVGDYVRELRARSSGLFTRFREFARSYETVIYGIGHCDEARYRRLHAMAAGIVHPRG